MLIVGVQIFILLNGAIALISVLDKGLVSLQNNSVGLQFYVDIENNNRISGCAIHSWTENCCLTDGEDDCNTMVLYGGNYFIKPEGRERVIFVYPSLYQHDQVGYCNFVLDYQCRRNERSKRQKVEVRFDTRINGGKTVSVQHYIAGRKKSLCDTLDLDSLHNCEPVNCDMKYSGDRSFFDQYTGKCLKASMCESDPDNELPDVAYVPSNNICRDLEQPLTVGDVYAISTGIGVVTQSYDSDEVKVKMQSNCSTISQNLKLLRDIMCGKLCPVLKSDTTDYGECCKSAMLAIVSYVGGVCALLISFFCCIHTMAWLCKKVSRKDINIFFKNINGMFKSKPKSYDSEVNSEVRTTLLREVIIKDIPIELRDSVVNNICDRMDRKIKRKKRYRRKNIGSQISLNQAKCDTRGSIDSSSSSTEDCESPKL